MTSSGTGCAATGTRAVTRVNARTAPACSPLTTMPAQVSDTRTNASSGHRC
ncbi:MAG: hypothetical protein M3Z50_04305 [Actinomycetota bacterium]|nr:hypothetical protein [Actinomycetota bacterium]